MLIRLISGTVYVAILVAFYLIKILVQPAWLGTLLFDILVVAFAIIGTFEMTRALKDKISKLQSIVVNIAGPSMIAAYAISDTVFKLRREADPLIVNYSPHMAFIVFGAAIAFLLGILVLRYSKTDFSSIGYSLLALFYPSAFLMVLSGINRMPKFSEPALLFVFFICPMADTFAYLAGRAFGKKLPQKMAPNVSPNKTIVGGVGGILGGAIGGVIIYFIYYLLLRDPASFIFSFRNMMFFVALGVLAALFSEFGDLVESAIKRKTGIKDMGKIMPGHGGILDRIDSTLYASLIVCFVFVIRIFTTG